MSTPNDKYAITLFVNDKYTSATTTGEIDKQIRELGCMPKDIDEILVRKCEITYHKCMSKLLTLPDITVVDNKFVDGVNRRQDGLLFNDQEKFDTMIIEGVDTMYCRGLVIETEAHFNMLSKCTRLIIFEHCHIKKSGEIRMASCIQFIHCTFGVTTACVINIMAPKATALFSKYTYGTYYISKCASLEILYVEVADTIPIRSTLFKLKLVHLYDIQIISIIDALISLSHSQFITYRQCRTIHPFDLDTLGVDKKFVLLEGVRIYSGMLNSYANVAEMVLINIIGDGCNSDSDSSNDVGDNAASNTINLTRYDIKRLHISGCRDLVSVIIPSTVSDLTIDNCPRLKCIRFRASMCPTINVHLSDLPSLTYIDHQNRTYGNFAVVRCIGLSSIAGYIVDKLFVSGCDNLSNVENLTIRNAGVIITALCQVYKKECIEADHVINYIAKIC